MNNKIINDHIDYLLNNIVFFEKDKKDNYLIRIKYQDIDEIIKIYDTESFSTLEMAKHNFIDAVSKILNDQNNFCYYGCFVNDKVPSVRNKMTGEIMLQCNKGVDLNRISEILFILKNN